MKKVVIILLVILPFLLIYFISVTGRILEKYSHIYVETLNVEDSSNVSLENETTILIEKGTTQKFKIVVGPELASNQSVTINNFNNEVCSYVLVEEELEIAGLKYGVSKIVITSIDQTDINFTLNIKVTDDVPTGIKANITEISIKTKQYILSELVDITFEPATTKFEYRGLVYSSTNTNVVQIMDGELGLIKGVSEGSCSILVTSKFDANLKVEIKVNVSNQKDSDVFFDYYSNNAYTIDSPEFDLKSITKFSKKFMDLYPSEEERFNQFSYVITSGYNYINIEQSDLNAGIIKFTGDGIVRVQIRMKDNPNSYIDELTIRYKTK